MTVSGMLARIPFEARSIIRSDHQVYQDSCDRYVKPDRQGPSRNAAMFPELLAISFVKGYQDERDDRCSQDDVGYQDDVVEGGVDPGSPVGGRFVRGMIGHVGDQEEHGKKDSSEHQSPMDLPVPLFDSYPPCDQYEGASAIDAGVQEGKESEVDPVIRTGQDIKDRYQGRYQNGDPDNGGAGDPILSIFHLARAVSFFSNNHRISPRSSSSLVLSVPS